MGFAVFKCRPTSEEVTTAMDRIMDAEQVRPKHLIVDQGFEFNCEHFENVWCKARNILPRFGAVGKRGSIAVVERFHRTLKEILRLLTISEDQPRVAGPVHWEAVVERTVHSRPDVTGQAVCRDSGLSIERGEPNRDTLSQILSRFGFVGAAGVPIAILCRVFCRETGWGPFTSACLSHDLVLGSLTAADAPQ